MERQDTPEDRAYKIEDRARRLVEALRKTPIAKTMEQIRALDELERLLAGDD